MSAPAQVYLGHLSRFLVMEGSRILSQSLGGTPEESAAGPAQLQGFLPARLLLHTHLTVFYSTY